MGFVRADESPNMIPATVPYTAAFIERPPPRPNTKSAAESAASSPIVIAHWLFGRVLVPAGRVAEIDEQRRAR